VLQRCGAAVQKYKTKKSLKKLQVTSYRLQVLSLIPYDLRLTTRDRKKGWKMKGEAGGAGLTLHPAQQEPKNSYDLGIIKRREALDKVYYKIDPLSPFFKPLCEICESAQKQNGASKK